MHSFLNLYKKAPNRFDNGTCGNYWSNYQLQNPDAVQISQYWSVPYLVNNPSSGEPAEWEFIYDHYPLVEWAFVLPTTTTSNPFGPFTITIPAYPLLILLSLLGISLFFIIKRRRTHYS